VAIKMEQNNVNTLRFEATILKYLTDCGIDAIPKVHWYGTVDDNKYLVMDYYDMTLSSYIQAMFSKYGKNETTFSQLDRLFDRMVEIIVSIHGCKIIHRDIKPENFMIRKSNIYLIDFGMATSITEESPSKNHASIIGTPTWVSYFIHDGYSPHYRDDLISVGYIYLSWHQTLPWTKQSFSDITDDTHDYNDIRHPRHLFRKKYKTWLNIEILCINKKIYDFLFKYYH
jgi:serine/threonine protein kinase